MTFWAYLLHCHGGSFYVGHTDDLERRIGEHKSGLITGFTADHLPVEHVWSQEFTTRDEAKVAEKQIKGWSRAKKLALIRGDWERISALAKGKSGPSTSSGETGLEERNISSSSNSVFPELVEGLPYSLRVHPNTPSRAIRHVNCQVELRRDDIWLSFIVEGPTTELSLPPPAKPYRKDGLWTTTCFEVFVKEIDGSYCEFNFSPSHEWAGYSFADYRSESADLGLDWPPRIITSDDESYFYLSVLLPKLAWEGKMIALSAVIEETDGTKSYWALAHPPGKPDFHHPACFALTLPAPESA